MAEEYRYKSVYIDELQKSLTMGKITALDYNSHINAISVWESLEGKKVKDDPKKIPCHSKMEGSSRPYLVEYAAKIEKAHKLGLKTEVLALEKELLAQDIRRLTAGAGYVEVTDKDLETMFEFPRLRRNLRWHNFKCKWLPFNDLTDADQVVVRLVKERAESSSIRIPYGAQLRLEEAKEKAIFESFQVVYPNVVTERQLAKERDPALVGLYNGSMFLICSWDLPQDVAKMDADIDALKALKLK